jgi:hypothetical protein
MWAAVSDFIGVLAASSLLSALNGLERGCIERGFQPSARHAVTARFVICSILFLFYTSWDSYPASKITLVDIYTTYELPSLRDIEPASYNKV